MTLGQHGVRARLALAVLVVAVALGVIGCAGQGSASARPAFAVLGSTCDPGRLAALREAGVSVVMTDLQWAATEPAPGVIDRRYLDGVRQRVDACRAAGMRVVLGLGLHNPPPWVLGLPAAAYVDQFDRTSSTNEANLVFSAAAREAATAYLREVVSTIGLEGVEAIRIAGELGFPGPEPGATGPSFWAFDPAAQTGEGIAAGVATTPMPGWLPGVAEWRGAPVTADQVSEWYRWYTTSLIGSVTWLADTLRTLGFTGDFHIPAAGRGVLAQDRAEAVEGLLDGRSDPDSALGRGQDYPQQFPAFAALQARLRTATPQARVIIDFTGLDDDTATRTRAAAAPEDTCHAGDTPDTLAARGLDRGATQRWTIAMARAAGLDVVAENPGPPGEANTGGSEFSDDLTAQMVQAGRYARECGVDTLFFAFEDELFTPGSGVDVPGYARVIADTGSGS